MTHPAPAEGTAPTDDFEELQVGSAPGNRLGRCSAGESLFPTEQPENHWCKNHGELWGGLRGLGKLQIG